MSYVGPMLGQAHQYLFYNPGKSKFAEEKTRSYTKHIYEILDKRLSKQEYFSNDLNNYPNVLRWYLQISKRPAVIKGYNVVGNFFEIPKP